MAILKNKDIGIMVEVEELLHNKLIETNGIKDTNGSYYFDEDDEEYEIWVQYWNLIERIIKNKKDRTKSVNDKNKTIYKARHKLNNQISYLRNKKKKNEQEIAKLERLLEKRDKMNARRKKVKEILLDKERRGE